MELARAALFCCPDRSTATQCSFSPQTAILLFSGGNTGTLTHILPDTDQPTYAAAAHLKPFPPLYSQQNIIKIHVTKYHLFHSFLKTQFKVQYNTKYSLYSLKKCF